MGRSSTCRRTLTGLVLLAALGGGAAPALAQSLRPVPWPARQAWAALGVRLSVEVRRFPVPGKSLRDAGLHLARSGPRTPDGNRGDAVTTYALAVEWSPRRTPRECRVADPVVSADIVVELPRWEEVVDATEREYTEWRAALAALERHEAAHRDVALAAAGDLAARLRVQTAPTCPALARRVRAMVVTLQRDLAEAQRLLDEPPTG